MQMLALYALKDRVVCYLCEPVDDEHLIRCLRAALHSGELPEVNSRVFGLGQGELKHGAARFIRLIPRPAAMGIDDEWTIDGFDFTAWGHDRNETGYPVNCCRNFASLARNASSACLRSMN
jgi:hypothetical protein